MENKVQQMKKMSIMKNLQIKHQAEIVIKIKIVKIKKMNLFIIMDLMTKKEIIKLLLEITQHTDMKQLIFQEKDHLEQLLVVQIIKKKDKQLLKQ